MTENLNTESKQKLNDMYLYASKVYCNQVKDLTDRYLWLAVTFLGGFLAYATHVRTTPSLAPLILMLLSIITNLIARDITLGILTMALFKFSKLIQVEDKQIITTFLNNLKGVKTAYPTCNKVVLVLFFLLFLLFLSVILFFYGIIFMIDYMICFFHIKCANWIFYTLFLMPIIYLIIYIWIFNKSTQELEEEK